MEFIFHHAKLQLPSCTIVNVAANGVIIRLGLMLPPSVSEACCSAREGSLNYCVMLPLRYQQKVRNPYVLRGWLI